MTRGAIAANIHSFTSQYPLWSDGARKRRWTQLPTGGQIDARSQADAWDFPASTRLWKVFSLGQKVESRMIDRLADGSWRYANYVWDANGVEGRLAIRIWNNCSAPS